MKQKPDDGRDSGRLEAIGKLTEVKREITGQSAGPYSLILSRQSEDRVANGKRPFHHL